MAVQRVSMLEKLLASIMVLAVFRTAYVLARVDVIMTVALGIVVSLWLWRTALSADHECLRKKLETLAKAKNWRGVLALEDKAMEVATALRKSRPDVVEGICCIIGSSYQGTGRFERAIALHKQCKEMAAEAKNKARLANACDNLAACYMSMHQTILAVELLKESKLINEELGNWVGVSATCSNLGAIYFSMEQYEIALELHEEHKAISETVGSRRVRSKERAFMQYCFLF